MGHLRSTFFTISILAVSTAGLTPAFGSPQDTSAAETVKQKAKNPGTTADNQKETAADRNTTKLIRRAVVKDDSLSSSAHNVKIITRNGMVTLKGPVRSEEEKKSVEEKAAQVAGVSKVQNDLVVSADMKDDKNAADRTKTKQ